MKRRDIVHLLAVGLAIWLLGTVYYAYAGPRVLETSGTRYWISFLASPILSALLCVAIMRRRRVPPSSWAAAMLLLAIPGMIGEAAVLSDLPAFMPGLHVDSGGRYGALLFATYAFVLAIAELVTLRASR